MTKQTNCEDLTQFTPGNELAIAELMRRHQEDIDKERRKNARHRVALRKARQTNRNLVARIKEEEELFRFRHNADCRAIKRWQSESPGRELTWPDREDLVIWLMDQLEQTRK